MVNAKVDGVDAFITSDLFSPHPTKSGYYCLYGRADDQIMHATGEKVNRFLTSILVLMALRQTNPGPLGISIHFQNVIVSTKYLQRRYSTKIRSSRHQLCLDAENFRRAF